MLESLKARPFLYSLFCATVAFFVTTIFLLTTAVPLFLHFWYRAPDLPENVLIAETQVPIGNNIFTTKERHDLTFHFVGSDDHGEVLVKDTNLSNNTTEQTYLALVPNAKHRSWTILDPYTGIGFASLVQKEENWIIYLPEGELKMYPITQKDTLVDRQDLQFALPNNEQIWV